MASRYRRYRQAGQQINMVTQAVRGRLKKLHDVLEKHHEVLPETLRDLAEDIRKQTNSLDDCRTDGEVERKDGCRFAASLAWSGTAALANRLSIPRALGDSAFLYCNDRTRVWFGK